MKIFFDTEFTGLHKDTTLISIGLVSESDSMFYAEFTDYDSTQVDKWIEKNVLSNLLGTKYDDVIIGDKNHIRTQLKEWLNQFETIEWVSDVCHYDFVLLIDLLFDRALDMPYGKWNSACHDINQDIANFLYISEIEAFDYSREQFLKDYGIRVEGHKHNSLYDATVIKEIYKICNSKK